VTRDAGKVVGRGERKDVAIATREACDGADGGGGKGGAVKILRK